MRSMPRPAGADRRLEQPRADEQQVARRERQPVAPVVGQEALERVHRVDPHRSKRSAARYCARTAGLADLARLARLSSLPMWVSIFALPALGYAVFRVFLGYPPPARPMAVLARSEVAFVAGAAEATFPAGGGIPASGLDAELPGYTDRLIAAAQPRQRFLMRLLFFLFEHATLFFPAPGRAGCRRFSSLAPRAAQAVLEGWRTSRLFPRRLVFTSLRAICTMGYFARPGRAARARARAVRDATRRSARPISGIRAIGAPRAAIRLTPADLTPPSDGTPLALDAVRCTPALPGGARGERGRRRSARLRRLRPRRARGGGRRRGGLGAVRRRRREASSPTPGKRVVLLEEGPPFTPADFELDGALSMARTMREGGLRTTVGTVMPTMQAIGLGGGSLVNSAICMRAPDFVLERWCERFRARAHARARISTPHYDAVGAFLGIAPTPEDVQGRATCSSATAATRSAFRPSRSRATCAAVAAAASASRAAARARSSRWTSPTCRPRCAAARRC